MLWLILIIIIAIVVLGVKVIPQSEAKVIERLGTYHQTLGTGPHYVVPFVDRVANTVTLKEIVKDFAPQPVITKDNVTMQIDTVVYFQITDPKLYTYGVENPINAIENLTATTLRNIIGELELDQTLTSRDIIILDRHLILRKRSRLIRTDNRYTSQTFHCLQLTYDCMFLCHLLRTEG